MWKGLLVTTIIICGITPTEGKCTLDNIHFYPEGAHWNPVEDTGRIGAGCVNCTCSNQSISCIKQECPTLTCDVPRYPAGACCPVCEDLKNIIPTVAPIDDGDVGEKDRKCEFEGRIYEHNQFFSNNNTHITPTRSNQCVNCICQSGQIYCFLKTCDIIPGCSQFYQSPETCCPICVDSETKENLIKKRPEDCKDGTGVIRRNSTSWNPDVAATRDPCISCTCLNGAISCRREQCPKLNCKGKLKVRLKGMCCKTCAKPKKKTCRNKNRKKKSKGNRRKNRKRSKKGRGRRKGGRRKKRKNRRKQKQICLTNDYHNATVSDKQCPSLPGLSSPIDGALSCHYKNLCLPDRTEYLVYRNLTVDNKTLILAFDNVKTQLVEIWTYAVHKDKILERREYDKCSSVSLRLQLRTPDSILGAATAKSVKDFQRKLRRGLKGCEKKKKGCRLRTVRRQMVCFELEIVEPKCKD
ncbi:uncharacterized protein LOC111137821 isoform X1 [Crassostrea virginica]